MTFNLPLKREKGREGESLALLQRRQAHSIIKDIELNLCYQNQKVRRRKGKDVEWKDQEVAWGSPASSPIPEHYKFFRRQSKNDVLG